MVKCNLSLELALKSRIPDCYYNEEEQSNQGYVIASVIQTDYPHCIISHVKHLNAESLPWLHSIKLSDLKWRIQLNPCNRIAVIVLPSSIDLDSISLVIDIRPKICHLKN